MNCKLDKAAEGRHPRDPRLWTEVFLMSDYELLMIMINLCFLVIGIVSVCVRK